MDLDAGCGTMGASMRGLLHPLACLALVAGVLAFASPADAQVFKPRTGTAARPSPVKTAAAPAPAKKPAGAATAAKKPAHHAAKKRGKKHDDDEDTVVVDDNDKDKDTDDVKVTDD